MKKSNIRTIELAGGQYHVAYNLLRMEEFYKAQGMDLQAGSDWLVSGGLRALLTLFTDMLNYGAERAGVKMVMDVEDVADLVGMDLDIVNDTIEKFTGTAEDVKKPAARRRGKRTTGKKTTKTAK